MVKMLGFHAGDPGSIPGWEDIFLFFFSFYLRLYLHFLLFNVYSDDAIRFIFVF